MLAAQETGYRGRILLERRVDWLGTRQTKEGALVTVGKEGPL